MIGRISPEKGQLDFLRAADLLMSYGVPAHFTICGAPLFGDTAYAEHVHRLAAQIGVEELGWRDDIGAVLGGLDLLIVPSREEGMGRVIVEAFSAGVPVVAFATGGIPELIADGETGFLTAENSSDALAARVCEVMMSSPEDLQRVARNARNAWAQHYAFDAFQRKITALLMGLRPDERVINGRAAQPVCR